MFPAHANQIAPIQALKHNWSLQPGTEPFSQCACQTRAKQTSSHTLTDTTSSSTFQFQHFVVQLLPLIALVRVLLSQILMLVHCIPPTPVQGSDFTTVSARRNNSVSHASLVLTPCSTFDIRLRPEHVIDRAESGCRLAVHLQSVRTDAVITVGSGNEATHSFALLDSNRCSSFKTFTCPQSRCP